MYKSHLWLYDFDDIAFYHHSHTQTHTEISKLIHNVTRISTENCTEFNDELRYSERTMTKNKEYINTFGHVSNNIAIILILAFLHDFFPSLLLLKFSIAVQ